MKSKTQQRVASTSTAIKKHFSTAKSAAADENVKLEAKLEAKLETIKIAAPSTPRRRDALSKQVPVTPRHLVRVASSFGTPRTPRTLSTPSQSTIYNVARQAFTRSSDPGKMVGREEERLELGSFTKTAIEEGKGECIYVSGPPGTGKSATVSEIVGEVEESESVKKAYVNCMSLKSSRDMSSVLLTTLLGEDLDILESEALHTLQGMFNPRKTKAARKGTMYIITLDEVDHVLTLDLEFLYSLFSWSMAPNSHLILIGIANALDLTDRLLPRLKARNLKPNLLPFLPYSAPQIKAVLTTRLRGLMSEGMRGEKDYVPFLHPAALELCARKVAAQSGDLRKAFDIVRRALDIVEAETKAKLLNTIEESPSKILCENPNLTSAPIKHENGNGIQALMKLTAETAPRASIGHLNKVTNAAFSNGVSSRLKMLNLQQKAALCALLALERQKRGQAQINTMCLTPMTPSKKNDAPTVSQLYTVYSNLCKTEAGLQPLTSTEFRDVVGSLETLSLISGVDGRGSFVLSTPGSGRGRGPKFGQGVGSGDEKRVGSCIGAQEVDAALDGVGAGILRGILNGSIDM